VRHLIRYSPAVSMLFIGFVNIVVIYLIVVTLFDSVLQYRVDFFSMIKLVDLASLSHRIYMTVVFSQFLHTIVSTIADRNVSS